MIPATRGAAAFDRANLGLLRFLLRSDDQHLFVRDSADAQDLLAQALVLLFVYGKPSAAAALARRAGFGSLFGDTTA